MNKGITLTVVLIAIISLSIASWVVHAQISDLQRQISDLQKQNGALKTQVADLQGQNSDLQQQLEKYLGVSDLKITSLEWVPGFNPVGSVVLENQIYVTVQNQGNYDVSGINLTVTVSLRWVGGDVVAYSTNYTAQADEIHAGESKEIPGYIRYPIGYNPNGSPNGTMLVGQLRVGEFVLDERSQVIPNLYY